MNLIDLKNTEAIAAVPAEMAFEYLALSIALGIILMILAVWSSKKIANKLAANRSTLKEVDKFEKSVSSSYTELVLGSANVLFLCFGMTGIMILVNNNLARAFAIGAAIAVIRFRIKFDGKGLGSTLFFGVLVGMACGVGQIQTAVGITLAYGILQSIIILLISLDTKTQKTASVIGTINPPVMTGSTGTNPTV